MPDFSLEFWIAAILALLLSIIAFGVGVGMDTKTRGEYWFVVSCFVVSGMTVIYGIVELDMKANWSTFPRVLVIYGMAALVVLGTGEAIRWAGKRHEHAVINNDRPGPASNHDNLSGELRNSPVLQASGQMTTGLPINIAPRSTVYILSLRPTLQVEFGSFTNDKDVAWFWPRRGPIVPGEFVSKYLISNHDTVRVFNVRLDLSVQFYFPNREGGGIASEVKQRVTIPALDPGGTYEFYVVNQSRYSVFIPFPDVADLQIQGTTDRVKVRVVPHGMLADEKDADSNPIMSEIPPIIAGSFHVWEGNKILTRLYPK